ncbi:hypothetical protein OQA88_697 [Cercophora sp. LCS_1]
MCCSVIDSKPATRRQRRNITLAARKEKRARSRSPEQRQPYYADEDSEYQHCSSDEDNCDDDEVSDDEFGDEELSLGELGYDELDDGRLDVTFNDPELDGFILNTDDNDDGWLEEEEVDSHDYGSSSPDQDTGASDANATCPTSGLSPGDRANANCFLERLTSLVADLGQYSRQKLRDLADLGMVRGNVYMFTNAKPEFFVDGMITDR